MPWLSQASTQHDNIKTLAWGNVGDTITYEYDANGSLTSKVTTLTDTPTSITESVSYQYNLRNRLETLQTLRNITHNGTHLEADVTTATYLYNTSGIRVESHTVVTTQEDLDDSGLFDDGDEIISIVSDTTTSYLSDPSNHTGYSQVVEETTDDGINLTRIQYTIGDDVISQTKSTWDGVDKYNAGDTQYLLYDGHGSTRQLADSTGEIVSGQQYSYDGYGVMLSDSTTTGSEAAANAGTSMLYAGEQFDSNLSMYYNRARYYNQSNGLFNRVDPYAGNTYDPQSLHKYAYCHNNPVNGIDPSGMFTIPNIVARMAIMTVMTGILNLAVTGIGSYNLAKSKFIPSGVILNISFSGQGGAWGLTAAATVSLFYHFSSKSLSLLLTPEAGFAPVSIFSTQRSRFSVMSTAGFVFNADKGVEDVKGYNATATWPRALANFVVPSPLRATPYYYAMMSYCNYLTGRWPGRNRVLQISQGSNGSTVEFSAGVSHNFAWTAGHTYEIGTADLSKLPSNVAGAVERIRGMFSGFSLQDAETPDKLIQIQRSADDYFESN